MIHEIVVKLNRACNLRCSYCYYINDHTEKMGSALPLQVLLKTLTNYAEYCINRKICGTIVFHGGEPLLMPKKYVRSVLNHFGFREGLFKPSLTTNGTLLDDEWLDLLEPFNINLGISLDGAGDFHNETRPTVKNRSSYDAVVNGIRLAQRRGFSPGVLCVVNPRSNGSFSFDHFKTLGIEWMDFLLPYSNHVCNPKAAKDLYGVAQFLVSAFLAWIRSDDPCITVRLFEELMRRHVLKLVVGKESTYTGCAEYIVLETDGSIGRDTEFSLLDLDYRTRFYETGRSGYSCNFLSLEAELDDFYSQVPGTCLVQPCTECSVRHICRGGSLGSRYVGGGSFAASSVHCDPLFALSKTIENYSTRCIELFYSLRQRKSGSIESSNWSLHNGDR